MKKLFFTITAIFITLFISCKRDSDILATFQNGNVTRGDLRMYYTLNDWKENQEFTAIKKQAAALEDIALQFIADAEFSKKVGEKSKVYEVIKQLQEKRVLFSLARKELLEKARKDGRVELANVQLMVVKPMQGGIPDSERAKKSLSEITTLKSDSEISAYITKNTDEDSRKPIGGKLEPHCINCGQDPLSEILNSVKNTKDKSFQLKQMQGVYFIIRLLSIDKVRPEFSSLYKVYESKLSEFHNDAVNYRNNTKSEEEKKFAAYYAEEQFKEKAKMTAEHALGRFESSAWKDEFKRIQDASPIKVAPAFATPKKEYTKAELSDATVLIPDVNGKPLTFAGLKEEYLKTDVFGRRTNPTEIQPSEFMMYFNQIYFPILIMENSPEAKKLRESDNFKKHLSFINKTIPWVLKQKEIEQKQYTISEKELRDTYEAGKLYSYSDASPKDPTKRIPQDYNKIKETIRKDLVNSRKKQEFESYISNLKKEYKLSIANEQLDPGKI